MGGNLALDFANTVHNHGFEEPGDDLKSFSDLILWAHQAGLLSEHESRRLSSGAVMRPRLAARFKASLRLRDVIYGIFSQLAQGHEIDGNALPDFNVHLRQAMAGCGVEQINGKFVLRWNQRGDPIDRVLHEVTRAAMELLTSERRSRIRQCAGESCTWLFVDTSRNGKRRWCDMRACGNRAKVHRFRQRGTARASGA